MNEGGGEKKRDYTELIVVGVLVIVIGIVYAWFTHSSGDKPQPHQQTAEEAQRAELAREAVVAAARREEAARAPMDVEPTFTPGDDTEQNPKNIAKAEAAERAVYARCSKFAAFREGSTLTSTYVPARFAHGHEIANVSVKLAHPEKANGNTLWYEVDFADGAPKTIAGQKSISSTMCGLAIGEAEPL